MRRDEEAFIGRRELGRSRFEAFVHAVVFRIDERSAGPDFFRSILDNARLYAVELAGLRYPVHGDDGGARLAPRDEIRRDDGRGFFLAYVVHGSGQESDEVAAIGCSVYEPPVGYDGIIYAIGVFYQVHVTVKGMH